MPRGARFEVDSVCEATCDQSDGGSIEPCAPLYLPTGSFGDKN